MEIRPVAQVVAVIDRAAAALAGLPLDGLSPADLLVVLARLERMTSALPAQSHRILTRLNEDASPAALGARSVPEALCAGLRISRSDARRRLSDAAQLGPRRTLTGQPLAPLRAHVAAAQAAGSLGSEHVRIIGTTLDRLPGWVDTATAEQAEVTLVRAAAGLDPDALRRAAERLLALLDQDGPAPDDAERTRRRNLVIGRQRPDGMSPVTGLIDPEARATLDAVFAKWAAPGMANPQDDVPVLTGVASAEGIATDTRSAGQRNHDALVAIARTVLGSEDIGRHNGLPVTVVVSTTLTELESAAGTAIAAGGTLLPMADLIRMASAARHYLCVFDEHTAQPLYLGRATRLATVAQRLVLHARDRGCTFPGCTVPGYGCQVHHVQSWARGGPTDVTHEVLACPAHNRLAELGYEVLVGPDGVEWIPPPHLDGGGPRRNVYHHPERALWDGAPESLG